MTAVPAPPPAPAPEAATPLPKFLGHPDSLCEQWIAETWEPDPHAAWDREDMQSAYREGRDEARRQLAPAWDALAARLAGAEAERDRLAGQVEWRDALLTAVTRVIGRYEDEELNAITAFAEVVAIIAPDAGPGAGGAPDAG